MSNFHLSRLRIAVLAAALTAAGAGVARADDSSLNPFTGESYAAFNGGNRPAVVNPSFDQQPSAWHQQNPNGLSERVFQSYSAPGENWHIATSSYSDAPAVASFHASHPNGLTEQELQALSSDSDAWQMRTAALPTGAAADVRTTAQAPQAQGERFARSFSSTVTQ